MKLTLLGTGSPLPSLRRASTGHLIEVGSQKVMVDAGPGTANRLLECRVQPTEINTILLSHLHFDHVGDLARILFNCWDRFGGIAALPTVIGPHGTRHMVEKLFGADGAFAADLTARTHHPRSLDIYRQRGGVLPRPWPSFSVIEIEERGAFSLPGIDVIHAPVLHHQPYLDSLGYRFQADNAVVAYSSDIAISRESHYLDSLRPLAAEADVLVHYLNILASDGADVTASKPALLGKLATALNVKKLVTTHHGPAMDKEGVREATLQAIASTYAGEIVWGEDKLTFEVGGPAGPALTRP
jgi:ribonuclease BN (tRNA processing enzyme)